MNKRIYIWIGLICLNICVVTAQTSEVALLNGNFSLEEGANFSRDMTYVPFDLVDGKILVNARIDGTRKTFMLDTGAPGLVLNKKLFKNRTTAAKGVTGDVEISQEIVRSFEWAGIKTSETEALVLNMSHLEAAAKQELAGLIGYDILKNAEVLFDYKRRLILLTKSHKSSWHQDRKPKVVIDFEMVNHLPIIKVKIGKKVLHLGLDCGAETNILNEKILKKINKSLIIKTKKERVIGLDKNEKSADVAWISETRIKKDVYSDMKYLFTDLSVINNSDDMHIDGLLGAPFFQSAVFSINYEKRKLYVW
jgi:hypothetical protein